MKVIVIDSFMSFLDKGTNLLKSSLARPDANDILHIGGRGVGTLVKLIKNCIFTSRDYNRLVGSRLYSNAVRGGPPDPVWSLCSQLIWQRRNADVAVNV